MRKYDRTAKFERACAAIIQIEKRREMRLIYGDKSTSHVAHVRIYHVAHVRIYHVAHVSDTIPAGILTHLRREL